jgi:hypothetical protein
LANLGSESETGVGSRVRLVGVLISIEKNFYRLPFTPPLSGSPYRSFKDSGSNIGQRRPRAGTKWAQASRPPFDLAANLTIYSPEAGSHERIHLTYVAEEQKSLRDTISERRDVLVV